MTLSLKSASQALVRNDELIAWGVGCHPRITSAQKSFDLDRFRELVSRTAIIGEVGLDGNSRVEMKHQVHVFRQVLEVAKEIPRPVSIHSNRATTQLLKELNRSPIDTPIMHQWTGTIDETRQAIAAGCYFSIHSHVARQSKFRSLVPLDRILVETDHGINDPPAGIPPRIQWVEHLVAQQYRIDVGELRAIVWQNFKHIVSRTKTYQLLPAGFTEFVS